MRSTGIPVLLAAMACVLLAGCPAPWPKYTYEGVPRTALRISAGEFSAMETNPLTVEIHADAEWQDAGVTLEAGDAVAMAADGKWNPDVTAGDRDCGPRGYRSPTGYYVPEVRNLTYGALIGRIGGGKPFLIGDGRIIAATRTGRLRMTCNRSLRSTVLGRGEIAVKMRIGQTKAGLPDGGG